MPLNTHVAGSPGSITALADELEKGFVDASDGLESSLLTRRTAIQDHWDSDAGDAAHEKVGKLREGAGEISASAGKIAAALHTYAGELLAAQGHMADARAVARAGGLTVTDRVIDGPPQAPDPSWETGIVTLAPAQEPVFMDWQDKVAAWNDAVDKHDDAVKDLAKACDQLVEDLGSANEALEFMQDSLESMVPGGLGVAGGKVMPGLERRMRAAATRAGFLASISPEQSRLLYANLFMQAEQLDDAALLRDLADRTRSLGRRVDAFMLLQKVMERGEEGQSLTQIIAAEGGGWVAGAVTTAGVWAGGAALFGSPTGPVGMVALGVPAAIAGAVAGTVTSNAVDDWYEDREFEQMVRDALEEGARQQAR